MDLERNILQIIRGEKKAPLIMAGLAGLSSLYRLAITARNMAYDRGLLHSFRLPVPVVSIGNLVVGGTGKTPLTHLLAMQLEKKTRLAILTRGFKSELEKAKAIEKISSGQGPLLPPEKCGDEPYFLAQKTKASIWVGADRVESGKKAIAEGANCILLDDGMQHRRLNRDFEIAIIDATDPFSRRRFLPWGLLRDSPKRLKNASLIVATHVRDCHHFEQMQKLLASMTSAPLVGTQIEVVNKEAFFPRKVGLFCGIGQPTHFLQTARDLNQEIVDTFILSDHGSLREEQLREFAHRCHEKGAEVLLCTEKDFVKLPSVCSACLNIMPVKIELKIIAGYEHWENLIENILDKVVK